MNLLMPLAIICPRKGLAAFLASIGTFPKMSAHMVSFVKPSCERFFAVIASEILRSSRLQSFWKRIREVVYLGVIRFHMLFKVLVGGEPEFLAGTIFRRRAHERSIVSIDVLISYLDIFEAFVEIETCDLWTFETFLAVKS